MELEKQWLRETYIDTLIELGEKNEDIVILDADLMRTSNSVRFKEKFPNRAFNVGIAEANMIGMAAGMSTMGKIPFTHTFTPFTTRRVCDQVTLSVAYAGLNIKMVGSDPGVTAELNGGTHMSMEDVAIMRNVPGMTVIEPVDSAQVRAALPRITAHDGPVYIRLLRRNAVKIFDDGMPFEIGKGILVEEGKDVTIVASGIMLAEAIEAAKILKSEGINAEVINIHTIKPLDSEIIIKSASKTGCVVTAENHNIINGLGSAVAEVLVENLPVVMERVGVKDHFGEVGKTDFLQGKYGLKAKDIIVACKNVVSKKQ